MHRSRIALSEKYNRASSEIMILQAGPSGFEPESEAPEAPMLSKLYYEPNENFC